VHRLEGRTAAASLEMAFDRRIERAEQFVPHFDHGIRRRGDHEVDRVRVESIKRPRVTDMDAVIRFHWAYLSRAE